MKILLIQSYLGRYEKPVYPVGLAYLGACLQDHDVQGFDPNVANDPYGELIERIKHFNPDVVGLSLRNLDTTQYRDPFVYMQTLQPTLDLVKEHAPEAIRIIGGAGFSIYADGMMRRFPDLQYGLLLEAEESFPALLKSLDRPETVPGVFYRTNGEVKLSAPAVLPDFNAINSPRWDLFDAAPYRGQLDTIGVQAKRGCGLKCAYCTYYFLNGCHYRLRNPEKVVAEIVDLIDNHKIDHFIFLDSVFNIPEDHAREVCHELIRQKVKVPWTGWYNEAAFSEDFFKLAKEAGCKYFSFSPDAYSDRSLKLLRKNLKVEDIHRVFELAKREKDSFFGYNFFVNPPGQTYFDFFRLMVFWLKVRFALKGRLYGFGLGNIRVEPDSEMFRIACEDGLLNEDTDLLAETSDELKALFYTNPKTPLINTFFKLYGSLANLKRRLRS
ncbi:cobalamin-dependent protein [bacterium]|nr:cobalamin-dependent protein [bacterium]MBU1652631.1 cobalamin-dependent protein [bacterium]